MHVLSLSVQVMRYACTILALANPCTQLALVLIIESAGFQRRRMPASRLRPTQFA